MEANDMFITSHLGADSLPTSFSKADAEHLADALGVSVKTVNNWLTSWVKSATIQHVAHGEYSKSA